MVKELVHDPLFLGRKSETATKADLQIAQDLLDTLTAHKDTCVGMAANMIGHCVRVIAFDNQGTYQLMLNPEIVKAAGEYVTEEGCLSLLGGPQTVRENQGALRNAGFSGKAENLHRLDSPDHPARNRPLQRNSHIAKRLAGQRKGTKTEHPDNG